MAPGFQRESIHYDLTYLEELSAGDLLFVRKIVEQFIMEVPQVMDEITIASNEQKWDDLVYQVHKFAPTLAFIGINDIIFEVNNLELYALKRTNLDSIPGLIDILKKRCELAINSLKQDFEL